MNKNLQRGLIGLCAGAVLVVAGIWGYQKIDASIQDYDVTITPPMLNADGASSAMLEVRLISRFGNSLNVGVLPHPPTVEIVEGKELVKVIPMGDGLRYRLVAQFQTGDVLVRVKIYGVPAPIEAKLHLTPSLADANQNGYPDVLDLSSQSDRQAFRRWFTTIAAGQLTHLDDRWHDRDCAGLIRYCYREALKRHDNAWLASRRYLRDPSIPDVQKYNYPNVPFVGTRVFRVGRKAEGIVRKTSAATPAQHQHSNDILAQFSEFAEAARLKDNSLGFVSRSPLEALPGDVIFYLNDTESDWPYHTMIWLGNGMTVYHTGPDGNNPGIVKKLSLAQLRQHPNSRWHPVESNPYFLGFYRWRILL
jgi:uncharacterized protein YfaT (DUF1175 family)